MNSNTVIKTAEAIELLLKTTLELYENYFKALEAAISQAMPSEVNKLDKLHELAQEASQALEDDLIIFDRVIATDSEAVKGLQEQLKIQAIYKTLQQ